MRLERTDRFKAQVRKLLKQDIRLKKQIEKTILFLADFPPPHPALRFKKMQGTDSIFECSVNMHIRITLEFTEDGKGFMLRNIDYHDGALRNP